MTNNIGIYEAAAQRQADLRNSARRGPAHPTSSPRGRRVARPARRRMAAVLHRLADRVEPTARAHRAFVPGQRRLAG